MNDDRVFWDGKPEEQQPEPHADRRWPELLIAFVLGGAAMLFASMMR